MRRIRIATTNPGKLREFKQVLEPLGYQIEGLQDLGAVEIVEDGDTFEANALKKARTIMALTGEPTLADDSGLVVDALDGAPGIYSARYADPVESNQDAANNKKLLEALENIPETERTARFVCALAYCIPGQEDKTFRGTFEGSIGYAEQGANGFGYDPLFVVAGDTRMSAQLSPEEKNAISHRGEALEQLVAYLQQSASANNQSHQA